MRSKTSCGSSPCVLSNTTSAICSLGKVFNISSIVSSVKLGRKDKAYDVFYECKSLSRSRIFRVRASGLDRVEIGSIIAGVAKSLATTLYAKNSISMIDFSKVSTDEEGNTQLEKGNFKRTNAFELLVDENELDFVMSELANLRGEACVFIIADNFECLMNFAFLKNHELLLSKRGKSVISVEIEGLV